MRLIYLFATLVISTTGYDVDEEWQKFKSTYGKTYTNATEEQRRFLLFQDNLETFETHNKKFQLGEVLYKMGINRFTDLSEIELQTTRPPTLIQKTEPNYQILEGLLKDDDIPGSIDWREYGAVTEIKDAGDCIDGDWAFAVTGAVESKLFLQNGTLIQLSPQSLLDCDSYDKGCEWGFFATAFLQIETEGLALENGYPFQGEAAECRLDNETLAVKAIADESGGVEEEMIMAMLVEYGPIPIQLDGYCLFNYESGIIDRSCECTVQLRRQLSVLLVGYNTLDGVDYWIFKNSWGDDWGEFGYFRLLRDGKNLCGVTTMPFYVVKAVNGN